MNTCGVAGKYRVSESWVRRLKQRRRETNEIAPRRAGNPTPPILARHHEDLRAMVANQPDATLAELCARLSDEHDVTVSINTLWRTLQQLKLSFKKRRSTPANRTARMSPNNGRSGR